MLDTGINQHIQVITVDGNTDITAPQDNVYYYDPNFKTGITLYLTTPRKNSYSGDAVDIVSQIVEAEMGDIYAVEALKAQAVAAFTYVVYHGGLKPDSKAIAPMKDASLLVKAVTQSVIGEIIYYNNEPINAVYSAIHADYSADAEHIWGSKIPYLIPVPSPYDYEGANYKQTVIKSEAEIAAYVKRKHNVDLYSVDDRNSWIKLTHDENDRFVKSLNYGGLTKNMRADGEYHSLGLRSPAFHVQYNSEKKEFIFTNIGWGHGCGMSQVGANGYAKRGWNYKQILAHYYPGITFYKYTV